jgi:hypothetical protein
MGSYLPGMTAVLQKYAAELKKLSPAEVDELSAWLSDYQRTLHQPAVTGAGGTSAWPDFAARARELFPNGPPEPSFLETLLEARSPRF